MSSRAFIERVKQTPYVVVKDGLYLSLFDEAQGEYLFRNGVWYGIRLTESRAIAIAEFLGAETRRVE